MCGAAVYPVLLASGLWISATALDRGFDPTLVTVVCSTMGLVLVALLERVLPYRIDWLRSHNDVLTDAAHLLLSVCVAGEAGRQLALLFVRIGWQVWPSGWPVTAQVLAAIAIADFGVYWLHRWQHSSTLGWRIHVVHHTAPRLYVLNASRVHPIDSALTALIGVAPLAVLGATPEILSVFAVVVGIHSALQHSNIDLRLGPLNWLLSSAEVHRWHHSRILSEANANYGQVLLIWDTLFGTRQDPLPGTPEVGLTRGEPPLPESWFGQLLTPFSVSRVDQA